MLAKAARALLYPALVALFVLAGVEVLDNERRDAISTAERRENRDAIGRLEAEVATMRRALTTPNPAKPER